MNEFPFSYQFSFLCRISDLSKPPQTISARPYSLLSSFQLSSKKTPLQQKWNPISLCKLIMCYLA